MLLNSESHESFLKLMKQVIRKGLKEIVVDEVPDPVVIPHHVIVRPMYSLISSGTETASIHQDAVIKEVAENPSHLQKVREAMKVAGPVRTFQEVKAKFSEYVTLGYAGAGVVADRHATVTDLEIGDRVAYGGEGTGHGEYVLVGRNLVVCIPDSVTFEHACFATLGSIALNAARTARIGIGDTVAIVGMGLVGQLISQLVRCQGGRVIAIDLRPERLELAQKLGAGFTLLAGESLVEPVNSLTSGRGADCVVVAAASKSSSPCVQALQICRDRGRIVVVGAVDLSFPWEEMYRKEIQLYMARAYGPGSYDADYEKSGRDYPYSYVRWTENRNMEEFLRLVAEGRISLQELITHEFALEDAPGAYQTILNPASRSLAVILRYPEPTPDTTYVYRPRRKVESDPSRTGKAENRQALRVGLIGAGNLAKWAHLPNIKKIPGAVLRAICSHNGVRGKSYALRFGAAYSCSDYREMLDDPEIDVVIIVTRNQYHASQAVAALRAGKHVFLEKPMALTEEECRSLYCAVQETGKQLTVGFNRRFAPFYREQKKRLQHRTSPAVINCRVNSPGISGAYWMADPSAGGAILGEACHFVDIMYWLLESEPVIVSAYTLPVGQAEPIGQNNMVASFQFADGSIGNLTYSTAGSKRSGGERLEVFMPGATVVTEDFKRLTVDTTIRRSRSRWFPDKGYLPQVKTFLDGIREGRSPEVTVRDGARATLACLRMIESARVMTSVAIDLEAVLH
jgi:predicted dehydrogenase/threonine dehydrogenase-like Zn-dependent dehydrogenase